MIFYCVPLQKKSDGRPEYSTARSRRFIISLVIRNFTGPLLPASFVTF